MSRTMVPVLIGIALGIVGAVLDGHGSGPIFWALMAGNFVGRATEAWLAARETP